MNFLVDVLLAFRCFWVDSQPLAEELVDNLWPEGNFMNENGAWFSVYFKMQKPDRFATLLQLGLNIFWPKGCNDSRQAFCAERLAECQAVVHVKKALNRSRCG